MGWMCETLSCPCSCDLRFIIELKMEFAEVTVKRAYCKCCGHIQVMKNEYPTMV